MFSSGPSYPKLKTNLRLAINRLKLLEKKKTELAQKARKEIADYISGGKVERARIRVEHIIREDYMVEAMEIIEMYCDLLLARFGLIQQMKTLDDGLSEAISSLLWVSPRLQADIPEMRVISDMLTAKYGKQYMEACREDAVSTISEKLKHKMSVQSPPKILVEKYMVEIAKNYNIEYDPDPQVMKDDHGLGVDALLVDINGPDSNNLGGQGLAPQPAGFKGFPHPPMLPLQPPSGFPPFEVPYNPSGGSAGGFIAPQTFNQNRSAPFLSEKSLPFNIPPGADDLTSPGFDAASKPLNINNFQDVSPPPYSNFAPEGHLKNKQSDDLPKPAPRSKLNPGEWGNPQFPGLDGLPPVPSDSLSASEPSARNEDAPDEIDFDDLTRRFEDLKKKK
ncbi:IST1 homolog isoform X1 [Bacillus rossius redtenbacheri]|uniref:IST1 homolog isoform X1 n=1 Tax=Bacillus rossius redtenbacheri TaxID=93214 RepID=UPI002FDE02C7